MRTFACVVGIVLVFGLIVSSSAQQQDTTGQQKQMSTEEMMKMAEQMAAPAEQHKLLAKLAGKWKLSGKFFIPGQEPMAFAGGTENTMILGDRFLQLDGAFESANPPLKAQSLSVYGYDKRAGKFTAWGIDTWGTYSVSAAGDYDPQTRTITLSGVNEDPGLGKVPFKFLLKFIDDTHYGLELHMEYPQMGWQKQMEVTHEKVE